MSLSLNCLIDGDDWVFTVKIPPTKNVSILKDMIKERVASRFNHIDALDLDLRRVSIPVDDLKKELGNLHLSGCPELSPARPPEVQKTVQALGSTQLLSLNCFVLGYDPGRVFTVKIPPTENVSILKDMIKEKHAPSFNHIDARDLDIWMVSFLIDDLLHKNPLTVEPTLKPQRLLSDLFSSTLDINHVHIVVRPPVQGAPNPNGPLRNPNLPYPTTFTSPDGSVKQFRYLSNMVGHPNLFFGRMADGNGEGTAICIKFVARYFKEGHEFLAEKGFAPKLHVVERLPGGLYMVVMDDVSKEYISLFNLTQDNLDLLKLEAYVDSLTLLSKNVRECLQQFHQAGFVHGDIRDTNIMVKAAGFQDGSFLLVDYDFCGKADQVRYPFDLNTTSVRRPKGATGGAVVKQEHDFEMLDYIWDP